MEGVSAASAGICENWRVCETLPSPTAGASDDEIRSASNTFSIPKSCDNNSHKRETHEYTLIESIIYYMKDSISCTGRTLAARPRTAVTRKSNRNCSNFLK